MAKRLSFDEVLNLSDGQLKCYIDKMLEEMNGSSMNFVFTPQNYRTNFRRGFLRDNIIICPKPDELIGYNMSDVDYVYLINSIKDNIDYDELMSSCHEDSFFDDITYIIDDYFGIEKSFLDEEEEDRRLDILYDRCFDIDKNCYGYDESDYLDVLRKISINTFCYTKEVKCLERAALLQNLLYILGFDSYIVMSLIKNEDEISLHAFNLVERNGKKYYVDSSINNVHMSFSYFLETCNIREISEQEFDDLLSGEKSVDINYDYLANGKKLVKTYSVVGNKGIADYVSGKNRK